VCIRPKEVVVGAEKIVEAARRFVEIEHQHPLDWNYPATAEAFEELERALDEEDATGHTVEVYLSEGGDYWWRRKAANNRIVSDSGEGYTDKQYAMHQARALNEGIEPKDLTIEETHSLPESG
jgi:uncharacterized protein YegP (UPF0339 family)